MDSQIDKRQPLIAGFNRGVWLTLAFVAALIILSVIQFGYRYRLPTDGWDAEYNNLDDLVWRYLENLVGTDSLLQPNAPLIQVEAQIVTGTASSQYLPAPRNWQVGETVEMVVLRGGKEKRLDVPVIHWTPQALWRRNAYSLDKVISLPVYLILLGIGPFTFVKRPQLYTARSLLLIPSVLVFALHFPQPKLVFNRHPWLGLAPYALGALMLMIMYSVPGVPAYFGWVGAMLMVLITIGNLIHCYLTQRDAVSRAQLRWVIGGSLISMFVLLMSFPPAFGWVAQTGWTDFIQPEQVTMWLRPGPAVESGRMAGGGYDKNK